MMLIIHDRKLKKVWCHCDHITNELVDDGFALDMFFEGDLVARIEVGTSNFITMPRFDMTGANGSGIIREWTEPCEVVWCHNWDYKDAVPVVTAAGLTKTMAPRDEKTIAKKQLDRPKSDVHDFYRNFVATINGDATQIVTHPQLMRVMKIMEAAFASDAAGKPVEIEDKIV
jgi:predicted dehydrogenase